MCIFPNSWQYARETHHRNQKANHSFWLWGKASFPFTVYSMASISIGATKTNAMHEFALASGKRIPQVQATLSGIKG